MSPGVVYGTPGGSLEHGPSFSGNAEADLIGAEGEKRVAKRLERLARKYPIAVLHDLSIPVDPNEKRQPNIDHVIIYGSHMWVLDAKVWKPMRYRTRGGRAYRGGPGFPMSLFVKGEPCDFAMKHTMEMATDRLLAYLAQSAVRVQLDRPLLVVCASSAKRATEMNLRKLKVPGADSLPEDAALARVERTVRRSTGFDHALVDALAALVRDQRSAPRHNQTTVRRSPARRPDAPFDGNAGW